MLALTSAGMASGSRGEEGGGADGGWSDARTCEMPMPVLAGVARYSHRSVGYSVQTGSEIRAREWAVPQLAGSMTRPKEDVYCSIVAWILHIRGVNAT